MDVGMEGFQQGEDRHWYHIREECLDGPTMGNETEDEPSPAPPPLEKEEPQP